MALIISPDSSILIDYFRSKDKEHTLYQKLLRDGNNFAISAIAQYEVLAGSKDEHIEGWLEEFRKMLFLPLNERVILKAREINLQLKRDRKQLDMPDILIAATAIANTMPLATLNWDHFGRIDGLNLVPKE